VTVRRMVAFALLSACVFAGSCTDRSDHQTGSHPTSAPETSSARTPAIGAERGGAQPPATSQADGPALRVVTMNIESAQRASVEKIAERIAAHRPDVVLLAEVRDGQADQFARLLTMHRAATASLVQPTDRLDTAVLCRWPLGDVKVLRSPRRAFGVMAATAMPDAASRPVPGPGPASRPPRRLHLVAVHQRSTHPGPIAEMMATTRQRGEETTLLLEAVAGLAGPIVIGGDFNEGAESFSLKRLDARFDNAFSKAGRGSPITFPGFAAGIRIDHIFHTRDLSAEDCFVDPAEGPQSSRREVGTAIGGPDLSDHRMVVATLRFVRDE